MIGHDIDIYGVLLENLSDGVMVIDFDGTVRTANTAFHRMFRLNQNEVVGRSFGDTFLTYDQFDEFTQIVLDAVAERGSSERRMARVPFGDESRSLSISTSCLTESHDGIDKPVALIVVVADITQIRELRENELRMAKVVKQQLGELQDAYRDIEARNESLSSTMKRLQAARGLAALAIVGVFIAIGAWYFQPFDQFYATASLEEDFNVEGEEFDDMATMVVEPSELRSTIILRGNLAPGRVDRVLSPLDSHLRTVYVEPGQQVAAGDPLVDLATGQLSVDYRAAEVEHIQAQSKLVELEDWANSEEMAQAQRALRRARLALDSAQREIERTEFLLDEGIIAASEHEDAQRHYENRKIDFDAAERELDTVAARASEEAIRIARLQAESARDRLDAEQRKLDQSIVRSPISGTVVVASGARAKPLAVGRAVSQGELLASVADFESLSVAMTVDEIEVRELELGQQAWITGPGFPGLRIEGIVSYVSSRAESSSQLRNAPKFETTVTLEDLEPATRSQLRVGMSAHVTVVVQYRPSALLVPLGAVEQSGGKTWISVIGPDADLPQRRAIEVGLTTLDSVEVVDGLSAGEQIAFPY